MKAASNIRGEYAKRLDSQRKSMTLNNFKHHEFILGFQWISFNSIRYPAVFLGKWSPAFSSNCAVHSITQQTNCVSVAKPIQRTGH